MRVRTCIRATLACIVFIPIVLLSYSLHTGHIIVASRDDDGPALFGSLAASLGHLDQVATRDLCPGDGERAQEVKVLLLKSDRTASNYVVETLNSHPEIQLTKEGLQTTAGSVRDSLAKAAAIFAGELDSNKEEDLVMRGPSVRGFSLEAVADAAHGLAGSVFSTNRGRHAFVRLLQAYNVRIIELRRRNVLAQAVSWLGVDRSESRRPAGCGKWNAHADVPPECRTPDPPINVSGSALLRSARMWQARARKVSALADDTGLPLLRVYYEDLHRDPDTAFGSMLAFLSLPSSDTASLSSTVIKRNVDHVQDRIHASSLDDVRRHLRTTCFDSMLHATSCSPIHEQGCAEVNDPCILF